MFLLMCYRLIKLLFIDVSVEVLQTDQVVIGVSVEVLQTDQVVVYQCFC